jgi:hypothetical protein
VAVPNDARGYPEQLSADWPEDLPLGLQYEEGYADEAYTCYVENNTTTGVARFTPEVRLRVAVLGDAIWCMQLPAKNRDGTKNWVAIKLKREAKNWLHGRAKSLPTFSFDEVCEAVGLDPAATHEAIERMLRTRRFDIRELIFWTK